MKSVPRCVSLSSSTAVFVIVLVISILFSLYIYFGFIYYSFGGEESIRLIVKEGEKKNPHIFEE